MELFVSPTFLKMKLLHPVCLVIFVMAFFQANQVAAQNRVVRNLLESIEGQWQVDDNGNVTYERVVEVPGLSKAELYNRGLNYFTYSYTSGKSVIQTEDKELGRIVGKGLYDDVHIGVTLVANVFDCYHIARLDVREGRARILLSLTQYEWTSSATYPPTVGLTDVSSSFPVIPDGRLKNQYGKAFYKSHQRAMETLDAIEKVLREGNTSTQFENDDW